MYQQTGYKIRTPKQGRPGNVINYPQARLDAAKASVERWRDVVILLAFLAGLVIGSLITLDLCSLYLGR